MTKVIEIDGIEYVPFEYFNNMKIGLNNEITFTRKALVGLTGIYQDIIRTIQEQALQNNPESAKSLINEHKEILALGPVQLALTLVESVRRKEKEQWKRDNNQ